MDINNEVIGNKALQLLETHKPIFKKMRPTLTQPG